MGLPNFASMDSGVKQVLDSVKNFSIDDFKEFVKHKKIELGSAGFLFLSLVLVAVMSHVHKTTVQTLEAKRASMQEKIDPIRKYKEVVKKQAEFLDSLPPALEESDYIGVLTDMASKRGVRITDFTPPVMTEERFFHKLTSKLAFTAPEFRNVILFISDLEQSSYAIKIESWALHLQQGKTGPGSAARMDKGGARIFLLDLTISSIKIEAETKKEANKK